MSPRMRKPLFLLLLVGLAHSVPAQTASETNGKAVFDKWCTPCHGAVAPNECHVWQWQFSRYLRTCREIQRQASGGARRTNGSYVRPDQNCGAARFVRNAYYTQDGSQRRGTGRRRGVPDPESEEVTQPRGNIRRVNRRQPATSSVNTTHSTIVDLRGVDQGGHTF